MNIAVVAPSPDPFVIGGTETLVRALVEHLNHATEHSAELLKIPVQEQDLRGIVAGYRRFSSLDLSHFDLVISTKYPSWMVEHQRHVCYMIHKLRGLYDTYPGHLRDPWVERHHDGVAQIKASFERSAGRRRGLMEILDRIDEVLDRAGPCDQPAFPGPFAKLVVSRMDEIGLSLCRIAKFVAISRTVATRRGYFPPGANVAVASPPPRLSSESRAGRHLLAVGRLNRPKRLDLLVRGMRHVRHAIPLIIAGTGPAEAELRELAANDPRIRFVGRVCDRELLELYADALAVPFVPREEDLGLVALEAMASSKAVITCTDSGGPLEFIRDGINGLVAAPSAGQVAAQIERLCTDRRRATALGVAARESLGALSWETVVETLIPDDKVRVTGRRATSRTKLTVATTFGVYPPLNGGQSRTYHLFRHLPVDVEVVSLVPSEEAASSLRIADNMVERRVPKPLAIADEEKRLSRELGGASVADIAMALFWSASPEYLGTLSEAARTSDAVVAVHPFVWPAIREVTDKPLWYEAQDFQFRLKSQILPRVPVARPLLKLTHALESQACADAEAVFVSSRTDAAGMHRAYGFDPGRVHVIPNGVSVDQMEDLIKISKTVARKELGAGPGPLVLFMGSLHGPNIEAAETIFRVAAKVPGSRFLLIGGAGLEAGRVHQAPPNVVVMGEVDGATKLRCLVAADVGINPVTYGTGTSLKVLEYAAAGVPVITTRCGARGLPEQLTRNFHIVSLPSLAAALAEFEHRVPHAQACARRAQRIVRRRHDWKVIARVAWNAVRGDNPA